jgi:hypothetical protein
MKTLNSVCYVNRSEKSEPTKACTNTALVGVEEGKKIFKSFYVLFDHVKQNIYVCGLIQNLEEQQCQLRFTGGPRSKSVKYFVTTNVASIQVSKKFFLQSFQISDTQLYKCC